MGGLWIWVGPRGWGWSGGEAGGCSSSLKLTPVTPGTGVVGAGSAAAHAASSAAASAAEALTNAASSAAASAAEALTTAWYWACSKVFNPEVSSLGRGGGESMGAGGWGELKGAGDGWWLLGDKVGSVWRRRGLDVLRPGRGAAASRPLEVERLLCLALASRAAKIARAVRSSLISRIAILVGMCTKFGSST